MGLEYVLQTLGRKDLDGYEQKLQHVLSNSIGPEFSHYWSVSFDEVDGKRVCIMREDSSTEPVYLRNKGDEEFYVRAGNTTRPLGVQSAHEYIGTHWTV